MQVADVRFPVQLCQIMLSYSLRVLYILSTGWLQANNWWVVVQDFKQNKQIKRERESWCFEWYFYYLMFYFLSIRKIIQSLTKSPIYLKKKSKIHVMASEPWFYQFLMSFRKTWSVLSISLSVVARCRFS